MKLKKLLAAALIMALLAGSMPASAAAETVAEEVPRETEDTAWTTTETTEEELEPTAESATGSTTVESSDAAEASVAETEEIAKPEDVPPSIVSMPAGVLFSNPAPKGTPVTGNEEISAFRLIQRAQDSSLVLKKSVSDNGNETFTLTLESYAIGTASVVTQVPVPTDVVLVLDESGSMNDCIECGHEMTESCADLSSGCLHKVYRSELNTGKTYRTYYRNSAAEERTVGYCSACKKWYSNGPYKKCSGHSGLGYWVPFETENDTHSYDNKIYHTQFYAACDHDTQRMHALKGAVTNFLNQMYTNSLGADGDAGTADDIDNQVAIVGYDTDSAARIYTPETAGSSGYVLANTVADTVGSLKNMISGKDAVFAGLSRIAVRSSTATNRGMEAAEMILAGNPVPAGEKRNRVVILFTDGSPGSGYENNISWANGAISYAHTIKQTHGATVYTVGLFWGADASDPGNLPEYDVTANGVNNPEFFRNGNRFLHLVSSNYPDATSLDSTGSVAALNPGEGYYLSTDDETGLYSIFGKLSNVVTPGSTTVTLDEETVVRDVITDSFAITDETTVTAWTESYQGDDSWEKDASSVSTQSGGPLTVTVSENTVTVTNFDYAENYVATDKDAENNDVYRGKKLVIQIGIQPIDGFLGGDDIVTNTTDSAIYAKADDPEPVKRFEIPQVDVPVKQILPKTAKRDIYLSQLADLPEILSPGTYTLNGGEHTAETRKNGYADIVYTITDPEGNTMKCTIPAGKTPAEQEWDIPEGMSQKPLLKEDTLYRVDCHVISVNNPENQTEHAGTAEINVYLPEITFQDSAIYLGASADYQNNFTCVKWFHEGTAADPEILGPAPELVYTYSPEAAAFRRETPIRVTVTAKQDPTINVPQDQEITCCVSFRRAACDFDGCDNPLKTAVDPEDSERINFVVHLKTFALRIEKTGADTDLDPGVAFLFRVTGPNGFSQDVVIHGNGHAVIKNLPAGTYRVTELTDWCWRYEPDAVTKAVGISSAMDGIATVRFANTRVEEKWLDGECGAENRFLPTEQSGEEAEG